MTQVQPRLASGGWSTVTPGNAITCYESLSASRARPLLLMHCLALAPDIGLAEHVLGWSSVVRCSIPVFLQEIVTLRNQSVSVPRGVRLRSGSVHSLVNPWIQSTAPHCSSICRSSVVSTTAALHDRYESTSSVFARRTSGLTGLFRHFQLRTLVAQNVDVIFAANFPAYACSRDRDKDRSNRMVAFAAHPSAD
jgi:hypothetical protein